MISANTQISLLDCTLRDGGLCLEDVVKNKLADIKFSKQDVSSSIELFSSSNIEIVELGSIEISSDDKTGFCIYQDMESISKTIPQNKSPNQIFAALYRGPDTPLEDIPNWNPSLCEAVRVIIRYSELQKSLDFCKGLSEKGYKVFVQPMLTLRYTEDEIDLLIKSANEMNAYALYFVDSYGYMTSDDVERLFHKYDEKLNKNIKIGFHAHNNMNLAFSNVLAFLDIKTERNIVVDSCIMGMGQGAGNLQTEIIAKYLNEKFGKNYTYSVILDLCEVIGKYTQDGLWGYSVTRLLPALNKTAYKYAVALRNHYKIPYSEIDRILENIPENLRHRYTPENTKELLKLFGHGIDAEAKT